MKSKVPYDRAIKTAEAYRLLTDSVCDISAGKFGSIIFETSPRFPAATDRMRATLRRMWLFTVLLTLSKLEDILDEYKAVFSKDVRGIARDLKKELVRRKVRSFRNTVVAHYRDNKLNRPLTGDEIKERVDAIIGGSLESFQAWIEIVVTTCERIQDSLGHPA